MAIDTIDKAVALLKEHNFDVVVNTDEDNGFEQVYVIVKGRLFPVFSTENTYHTYSQLDVCILEKESILGYAKKVKKIREGEFEEARLRLLSGCVSTIEYKPLGQFFYRTLGMAVDISQTSADVFLCDIDSARVLEQITLREYQQRLENGQLEEST